jgi:hypothetical protein
MPQRRTIRAKINVPSTAIECGAMSVNGRGPRAQQAAGDDADARYAISIFGEWHSANCSTLHVCQACAEADAALSLSDKKVFLPQLPFQKSVFSKLADIGRNHTLQETPIFNALPADWTTLHVLIGWTPEDSPRSFGICLDATG